MGFLENIALAFSGLRSNKMRAFLTMLGIIIGIGSVIAISTLGSIMENSVLDIFNSQGGANLVAFQLNMKDDNDGVIYLKRLFFIGEKPIAIGRSWLPGDLVPDMVEKGLVFCSITDTLRENFGIIPSTVDDYVEVVRCSQSYSVLLKCTMDVPLLLVKGRSSLENSRVIEYSETSWLGDFVRFHLHFKSTDKGYIMGN